MNPSTFVAQVMNHFSSTRGAQGTRAAANVLRSDPPVPVLRLYVIDALALDDDGPDLEDMVSALEANRDIHTLGFKVTFHGQLLFDPTDGADRHARGTQRPHPTVRQLERLFGEVLPVHRSLKVLSFDKFLFSSHFIKILMESLRRHGEGLVGLERLTFWDLGRPSNLWDEILPSVVDMLRSDRVTTLKTLDVAGCGLSARHCQQLFEGLIGNRHLVELNLSYNALGDDSVSHLGQFLSHPSSVSNLRVLNVGGMRFTSAGVRTLAHALKPNRTLEELTVFPLDLDPYPCEGFQAFEDILLRFNYTLVRVSVVRDAYRVAQRGWDDDGSIRGWGQQRRINDLLSRNVVVRQTHNALCQTNYRVTELRVWPIALERLASKPALLYRFVRRGNLTEWCNVVGREHSIG